MHVKIIDSIWCKAIDNEARGKIRELLEYEKVWFIQGQYSKIKKSRSAFFINKRTGFFLCGFLPRLKKAIPELKVIGKFKDYGYFVEGKLGDIHFRKDQIKAIKIACEKKRGVIKFATASGKTVIAAGIINAFGSAINTVFLAHNVDIVNQTYEKFKSYGFQAGILTGDIKENYIGCPVLCSTYQSYLKHEVEEPVDLIIIDEAHHVNRMESQYGKILTTQSLPMRIGLSGTLPNDREGKLTLEGLVGPVITKLSIQEGIDKGILSLPKITLLSIKKRKSLADVRKYYDIRDQAIINNKFRNRLIARAIYKRVKKGKSCLIIVNEIMHGDNIRKEVKELGYTAKFLQGKTSAKIRNSAKEKLINKRHLAVITTNIWNEGVDIPTLDVVILAFGGKANTRTIQALGRGLRRTENKKRVEIIDFLDPYRYLAEHVVARLNIYKKEKLL